MVVVESSTARFNDEGEYGDGGVESEDNDVECRKACRTDKARKEFSMSGDLAE